MKTNHNATDLTTFEGWQARAIELLKDKPHGTALVDRQAQILFLLIGGEVCSMVMEAETMLNASNIDSSAWSGDAWDGQTPEQSQAPLLNPEFIDVSEKDDLESASVRLTLDVSYTLNGESLDDMVERLRRMCERAIGEGMLTGDTPAEVESYSIEVTPTHTSKPPASQQ